MFVTVEDTYFLLIEIRAAVEVVVIACRVVERREDICLPLIQCVGVDFGFQCIHEGFVCRPVLLLHIIQTIQTDILHGARAGLVTKGNNGTCCTRNVSPYSGVHTTFVFERDRKTMLEGFLSIMQDIFVNVTQVDVHLSGVVKFMSRVSESRIHQPELDILYVRFLKICVIQPAHHSAPALFRVGQFTIEANLVRCNIILSALIGVEGEVENR